MVDTFKAKIFRLFFSKEFAHIAMRETLLLAKHTELQKKNKDVENKVNQRVAEVLLKMDPLEPLFKKYNVLFSAEYEHPEESLDERSKLSMYMWGFQQHKDPHFHRFANWIIDCYGNQLLKKSNPSPENLLYNRAQMGGMILAKAEIQRLSNIYEKIITNREEEIDDTLTVE